MIFLQPLALLALPLITVPLIIHWLNHRRHTPVSWGAMQFLKQAQKHDRGAARLLYWILLAIRMCAIAATVFVLSRPLQSGYLASWTGAPATTLIVLDLSPSMQSEPSAGQGSLVMRAIEKLDRMRRLTGRAGKPIVFTQPSTEPIIVPDDIALSQALTSTEQAASTDIPATVNAALNWASSNTSGPIDVWVCSDLRESDWQAASPQWQQIVERVKAMPAVRLNILAIDDDEFASINNASITVERVLRRQAGDRAELVFDLRIEQSSVDAVPRAIPLSFVIAGTRTTIEVELTSRSQVFSGMVVPIDPKLESGFGLVSIPMDTNSADNQYRFVFAKPVAVQAIVVAENANVGRVLRLALERPASDESAVNIDLLRPDQVSQIQWQNTALIVWQSTLPGGDIAVQLHKIIERGGSVLFLPPSPTETDTQSLNQVTGESPAETLATSGPFYANWGPWQQVPQGSRPWQVSDWRSDSDLLRNSATGESIPVNEWTVQKFRTLRVEEAIHLAKLTNSANLLTRVPTERGGLYFLATLPTEDCSNLLDEGISLYVLMQRALEASLTSVGNADCLIAGQEMPRDLSTWNRLDESEVTILDNQRALCSAVYQRDSKLIAINRPVSEDNPETIGQETLRRLLNGVDYELIEDSSHSQRALASEVWRWCAAMLIACLMLEGWLTMPRAHSRAQAAASVSSSASSKLQFTLMRDSRP